MLGVRLLVVLFGCKGLDALVDTVLDAVSHAASPFCLRFALPLGMEAALEELPREAIGGVTLQRTMLFYPEAEGLQGVLPLLTDETHFLALRGPCFFSERWDRGLFSRLRRLRRPNALLTGFMSAQADGFPPQAYLPAWGSFHHENGVDAVSIVRGLPLVCAAAPVKTMLLNPGVVFGAIGFLRQAETRERFLSIAAFVAGFSAYSLDKALLWPARAQEPPWLYMPRDDQLPNHYLGRFEQFAGLDFHNKRVSEHGTMGLFPTEDSYPQKMPAGLWLGQIATKTMNRAKKQLTLLVTAFVDLPDALKPAQHYMLRFGHLRALGRLPMLVYAGGRQEHSLRMRFPNTFSYPDNALLPRTLLHEGMTPLQHFQRSTFLLLSRSMHTFPEFSHYAWVDFDTMEHPVCRQAVPDFSRFMDDRIHLAAVDDEPDGSFMVVPGRHLKLLAREALALSQMDVAMKRGLSGSAMLSRLIQKFPDLFMLHPMPRKNLLFATGFQSRLLCEEYREALKGLLIPQEESIPLTKNKGGKAVETG
ncbi:MAG: hypothetical protein FWF86_02185 [Clostridia bacterium]|nr:hypothetical protein [Clostridia bacterium]